MLKLYLCKDRKLNTQRMLAEIAAQAGQGVAGQFLIVPEQFSHMMERRLCQCGGDRISRYAEVLGFSRLATRVFSEVGGCAQTETDPAGRLLAMSLAVEQVRSRLKIYASCADKPEFLLQMLDTFDELRAFCVTADRLRAANRELTGALAVKMEEIALLMDSFDAVCSNMGQNPQTRLTRLLGSLEESGFAKGKHFYFDGFTDFNGIEREIIAQLLCDGAQVTVNLHCDHPDYGGQQFESARRTVKALVHIAREQSIETKLALSGSDAAERPIALLRDSLFFGRIAEQPPQEEVSFVLGTDRVAECRAAVGELLRLVQGGLRWRDISIACADLGAYRPVLESLLRRAEIPAYYAGDAGILTRPVVRMLLSALESATDDMEQETVLAYLKSGFLPISRESCDRLENYALTWTIRGDRWAKEWTMDPAGVDHRKDAHSLALLQQLNEDRKTVILPLLHLRAHLKSAKNTAEMVVALDTFLEEISLRDTLHTFADKCCRDGDLQKAQEYAQLYGVLVKLMEQMYGVLGESVRTPEEFYRIFRTALAQCDIGTIPARLDCVTVGSLMSQRRCDTKVVFLLGANEGSFPAAQENRSLLTDGERDHLRKLGIELALTAAGRLDNELAAIDSVLNAPEERLYLGAVKGAEAYFFTRARRMFPQANCLHDDAALIARSGREYLAYLAGRTPNDSLPLAERARQLSQRAKYRPEALEASTVRELFGQTLRLSATSIDDLASCRYRYFLKYGLRAKERRVAEVDRRIYGIFVHDVLEHTVKQVQAEGGFAVVPLQRVLELAEQFMMQYEQSLTELWDSPRALYLFRRNFAEVRMVVEELYNELSVSRFEPKWFELKFSSKGGTLPSVRIVGEAMCAELEGTVDRADLWRDGERVYVRVVDYKTGKKGFSYTDIFSGLSLQMLLYLFALIRMGETLTEEQLKPAGVLYFPARMESFPLPDHLNEEQLESKRIQLQKRSGLLLDSEPVLQAMEPCEGAPRYLPYSYDKNEERCGDLATKEQLETLERFVFQTVAALGDTLYQGAIEPNPYFFDLSHKNACCYCPYQTVCGEKVERRWPEKFKNGGEFWQRLEESDG